MKEKFNKYRSGLWLRTGRKTVGIVVALCVLMLFGDSLLPITGHLLHVLIEVIESILEHFLESFFDLSARQAQILLFWMGLLAAIYGFWRLSCKVYFKTLRLCIDTKTKWQEKTGLRKAAWVKAVLFICAMGTTLVLLS